ncbi:MAG: hypothetical protein J1E35_05920 [Lachnospiraceae bacterium]|nr:hypothetical protein [Lachnospiraceae bacterium]
MNVFKEEIKKNIKKYHIGVIVLVLLIVRLLSGVFLTENSSGVNSLVELIKEDYLEFIDEFGGAVSKEFESRVLQMNAQQQEAEDRIVQLALGVEDGVLRQKDYVDGLLECYEVLEQKEVMKALNNQLNYIKENPERRYFMYTNGWVSLFQNMKLDYMYLVVLILVMAPLFVREYETKMDVLNLLSKNGRGKLYFTKIVFAVVFSFVTAELFFAVDLLTVQIRFGIEHSDYPLQSLHIFMENVSLLTIGQHLMTSFWITAIGGMLTSAVLVVITLIMKKMIPAIIVFLSVLMLPYYMFEEYTLAKHPNLTTLLTRTGYVVGIRIKESSAPYFMDEATIKMHLLVYCLFILGLVFLGYVIYCKKGKLLCFGTLFFLVGCGKVQTEEGVNNWFNINMMIANENCVIDVSDIPRVMTGDSSEALLHDAFYGCEPYTVQLGYLAGEELYYLKNYAEKNAFEICKTNLRTFETVSIYKELGNSIVGYPYLRELSTTGGTRQGGIDSFYVSGDNIILYKENRFYQVNRKNGKESVLVAGMAKDFAFFQSALFYISDRYELFCVDLNSGKEEKLCDFLVSRVFAFRSKLYIESLEQVIYAYEIASGEMTEMLCGTERLVCVDESHIYHLSEENVLNIVDVTDGKRREVALEWPVMEVESYRNGEIIYLYVYKNDRPELIMITKDDKEVINDANQ